MKREKNPADFIGDITGEREYDFDVSQGYKGTFEQWLEENRWKDKPTKIEKYFDSWADDYDSAFGKSLGRNPLQALVNRFFRRKTFYLRHKCLTERLKSMGLKDKDVLDIGCGTGQLAMYAASQGANVIGLDISKEMIRVCNDKVKNTDLAKRVNFKVWDCFNQPLPKADIVLCVGVIEYYKDIYNFLKKMFSSTKETLILVDGRYVWWRALLRKILGLINAFSVFYHPSDKIRQIAPQSEMRCVAQTDLHSFRILVFKRIKYEISSQET